MILDKKGKEVEGKIVQHGDRSNFTFDTLIWKNHIR